MNTKRSKPITASLDGAAATIAANMQRQADADGWDQERIAALRQQDGKVGSIPIAIIKTGDNVRRHINVEDQAFQALLESIRKVGCLQSPVVTVHTNEHGVHTILLIAGGRRLRALQMLGQSTAMCLVRVLDSPLLASMSENVNRAELHPFDLGEGYRGLTEHGYKHVELVRWLGRDRKTIGRFIKLASWPDEAKRLVRKHPLKFTTKRLCALASRSLTEDQLMLELKRQIGTDDDGAALAQAPPPQPLDRLMGYFEQRQFTKSQRELIVRVLTELKVLKKIEVPKEEAKP